MVWGLRAGFLSTTACHETDIKVCQLDICRLCRSRIVFQKDIAIKHGIVQCNAGCLHYLHC